jgi:hypothetical protein
MQQYFLSLLLMVHKQLSTTQKCLVLPRKCNNIFFFFIVYGAKAAVNHIKVCSVATKMQQYFLSFVIVAGAAVAIKNIKVFSAAVENSTIGSHFTVVELQNISYCCQQQ